LLQLNKIAFLYFIRTVIYFFVRDVHRELGLVNVHLFDVLPAISSGKVGDFFSGWRVVNPDSSIHSGYWYGYKYCTFVVVAHPLISLDRAGC